MIICICEGVSDKTIRAEIDRGASSVKAIKRRCGAGGGCGQCVCDLKQMLGKVEADLDQHPLSQVVKLAS